MKELLDAPTQLTVEDEEPAEWDPLIQRHLYEKTFAVWNPCDALELTVDAAGRVVAFRDRNRAEPKTPPALGPLEDEEVLKIAGTSGWVGPGATLDSSSIGLMNMLVATVTQSREGFPACVEYTLNPDARHLVSFKVIKF
jgi:hypothetical protein